MKTLALVFKTNSTSTLTINLSSPRDNLTLDEVKLAAAKMVPVLITNAGVDVTELEKAAIITTSEEELA
ncbi:DUF2922 domain-containing protein [uncultured Dialister sp.]|uniref:DUF2922 domain-containing protein n=1 Tax=uncultured Dialister sp. TaxID=278064 RepID=UPI00262726FE|nr:DUF2922 domain-containing protein [uncultured Dialister sp.]